MSVNKMASDTASRSFNLGGRPPDPIDEPDRQIILYNREAMEYDMTGNKRLVIFNHRTYRDSPHFKKPPPDRISTNEDVKRLRKTFGNRHFEVTTHNDLVHRDILNQLAKVVSEEHSRTSCLAVAILTHGDENGMVYAADRQYPLNDVINMVLNHPALAGKPKLFLIQACRGHNVDEGHGVLTDGGDIVHIPTHSDFLMLRSCVEGYVSFRGEQGSWMIQALCDILDVTPCVDILNVIVQVNNRLSKKKSSNLFKELHNKKQTPETTMTLTKFLYI